MHETLAAASPAQARQRLVVMSWGKRREWARAHLTARACASESGSVGGSVRFYLDTGSAPALAAAHTLGPR